ncbi:MAG: YMGG-like glycine zipper-containing protein [Spongiibacteraceae bacterium]
MKILRIAVIAWLPVVAQSGWCGDLTTDAAIGGAIGGAVGGAVGAQVGGREGAVVGAGIGGAAGAAIATQGDKDPRNDRDDRYREHYDDDHHHSHPSHFCPPGQAKKGRC